MRQYDMKKRISFLWVIGIVSFLAACAPQNGLRPQEGAVSASEHEQLFFEAEDLFQNQRLDDAKAAYQRYLQNYPRERWAPAALMKIAQIQQQAGLTDEAATAYSRLISDYPDSPFAVDARLDLAQIRLTNGDFSVVIQMLSEIQEERLQDSQKLRTELLMGQAYLASGNAADAFYHYYSAHQASPPTTDSSILAGLKEAVRELNAEEIGFFLSTVQEPSIRAELQFELAKRQVQTGQYEEALKSLAEFKAAYPDREYAPEVLQLADQINRHAEFEPFTLGCLLPLSGNYSAYGSRALKGIEYALSVVSSRPGAPPFRLVVEDSNGDATQAIEAVDKLVDAGVGAILGPMITAEAAARQAQVRGIPIITMTQKESITETGDYVFRNFITPQMQVEAIVSYAIGELGFHSFAILYPDETYGITFMNRFWDAVIGYGATVTAVESYNAKITDFAEPIKKLVGLYYPVPREFQRIHSPIVQQPETEAINQASILGVFSLFSGPARRLMGRWSEPELNKPFEYSPDTSRRLPVTDFDAIFIPDSPKVAGLIIPQLAYYDVRHVRLLGTNLWHAQRLIDMSRQYIQGALIPEGFPSESTSEEVQQFTKGYQQVFGEPAGFIEANAFDSATILFDILRQPDVKFRSDVRQALVRRGPFGGVTGRTLFDQLGEAQKEPSILQIRGSTFVEMHRKLPRPQKVAAHLSFSTATRPSPPGSGASTP